MAGREITRLTEAGSVDPGFPVALRRESLEATELEVASELAHAFLMASRAVEVYRLALGRVTPLVGADFSSVFLRDPEVDGLLKLACAHNWPQSSARYLGELRVRVGRGPTGKAVSSGEPVEVEDIFSNTSLREWWEPARELGFASMITLPLKNRDDVVGALSFYFEKTHRFERAERQLLHLVADQLAATAERAYLIEDLQDANRRLRQQNEELARKVREAKLARQLKNEFLANISHELRTPLTSILGYTYLLQQEHLGPVDRKQKEAAERIDRSAGVLLRLIGDLLDLSQLKLGRVSAAVKPEDAGALARLAVQEVGPPPESIDLRLDLPDEPLEIRTDGRKVVKILRNMLSNAFKFTPEGTVKLSAKMLDSRARARDGIGRYVTSGSERADGSSDEDSGTVRETEWVEWVIEDEGIGIEEEKLSAIFDEFRQVDGSSTRLYGGTGLGLALSLRLARLLGGDIAVESEPDLGSRFSLRLPLSNALLENS